MCLTCPNHLEDNQQEVSLILLKERNQTNQNHQGSHLNSRIQPMDHPNRPGYPRIHPKGVILRRGAYRTSPKSPTGRNPRMLPSGRQNLNQKPKLRIQIRILDPHPHLQPSLGIKRNHFKMMESVSRDLVQYIEKFIYFYTIY